MKKKIQFFSFCFFFKFLQNEKKLKNPPFSNKIKFLNKNEFRFYFRLFNFHDASAKQPNDSFGYGEKRDRVFNQMQKSFSRIEIRPLPSINNEYFGIKYYFIMGARFFPFHASIKKCHIFSVNFLF